MATVESPQEQKVTVKEMSWDPVTRTRAHPATPSTDPEGTDG